MINIQKIEHLRHMLLDNKVTAYRVAKMSGMTNIQVARFKNGESKIENMRIKTGLALCETYDELKSNESTFPDK